MAIEAYVRKAEKMGGANEEKGGEQVGKTSP